MRNGTCTRYLLYGGVLITAAPYSSGTSAVGTTLVFLYLLLIIVMITSLIIGSRRSLTDFHRWLNKLGIHCLICRVTGREGNKFNWFRYKMYFRWDGEYVSAIPSFFFFYKRDFWLILSYQYLITLTISLINSLLNHRCTTIVQYCCLEEYHSERQNKNNRNVIIIYKHKI